MHRRQFLSLAGAGLAAACLDPRIALAQADARARFARAIEQHPWLLGWRDAEPRSGWQRVQVDGDWPQALRGTLYRNGPGLFSRGEQRYRHWFDGDGLLQAWRIDGTGIRHHAQFVPTPKFRAEQAEGRFLYPAIGTRIENARGIRHGDDLNTANTAVVEHAGGLYALWEGGSAFGFEPGSLSPQGLHSWGEDLDHLPFSAHPLRDGDGTLWNFGLFGDRLLVWKIDASGRAERPHMVELPFAGYLHAFSMNAQHLVFVLMPYVLEGNLADEPYFEALSWQPARGCRALVLDKADLSRERWFGLPAGAAYHYGPMRQQGSRLSLQACWYDDGEAAKSPLSAVLAGRPEHNTPLPGRLQGIELDLSSGRARLSESLPLDVDFPVWDEAGDGRRLYAPLNSHGQAHAYFDQLACIDVERGLVDRYDFGSDLLVEEHRFVPSPDGRGPGWLLGTALDVARRRSGLFLFEADRLAAGPRAVAWLDQALPLGFHGSFSPA